MAVASGTERSAEPAVDARPRPGAADLALLQSLADPRVSAGGDLVAYVVGVVDVDADEDRTSIWVVPTDSSAGPPRALTHGPHDRAPRWSPDGRLSFVRKGANGSGDEIRVLSLAGGESAALLQAAAAILAYEWSPAGDVVAFTSITGDPEPHAPIVADVLLHKLDGIGRLKNRSIDLFVHAGGETRPLTDGGSLLGTPAWSPDGRWLACTSGLLPTPDGGVVSHICRVDVGRAEAGPPEQLTHWEGLADAAVWTPTGDALVFTGVPEPDGARHNRVLRVPATGGVPEVLFASLDRNVLTGAPGYPGAPLACATDGRIVFCIREGGDTHLVAGDPATGAVTPVVADDGDTVTGASTDPASTTVAAVVLRPDRPAEVVVTALDGRGRRERTTANRDAVANWHVETPEPRVFLAPDGSAFRGWLRGRDRRRSPQPVLLDIHGGPHNAWVAAFDHAHIYHHTLIERGWLIVTLNTRGSDGYGQAFFEGLHGRWGEADAPDFLAALDALVDEGAADPSRLAVAGYSYGGFMAAYLTAHTDRFRAAVAGGCFVDAAALHDACDIGALTLWREWGSRPHDDHDAARRKSPIDLAAAMSTPTLILHGEGDQRCPVGHAEQLFGALQSHGVESRLVLYPGAGHTYLIDGRPSHRRDHQERIVDWLVRHVEQGGTNGP